MYEITYLNSGHVTWKYTIFIFTFILNFKKLKKWKITSGEIADEQFWFFSHRPPFHAKTRLNPLF